MAEQEPRVVGVDYRTPSGPAVVTRGADIAAPGVLRAPGEHRLGRM